jgi:drug/metabolite transporter (DMT)-like permease
MGRGSVGRRADPMDTLTIALMLAAALLHASWHSLVKSSSDQIGLLAGIGLVAASVALVAIPLLPAPPAAVWPVLMLSAALHVAYKLCLVGAYARGEFGQAFPLARGMIPLFASLIAFVSLGQVPTAAQCFGIALVSAGLLLVALDGIALPGSRLVAAAAGAGAAVACYSTLDAYGTRLYGDWAGFTAWLVTLDNLAFLLLARTLRGPALWTGLAAMKARVLISGVLGILSFSVLLWALSRAPVGAVTALRETSVLFAVLIGGALHREVLSPQRLAGAAAILAGALAIAL